MRKTAKKMSARTILLLLTTAILLIAGLAGFGYIRYINTPDYLHVFILHISPIRGDETNISDFSIDDAAKVQAVYQTMTALDNEPTNETFGCPIYDDYETYSFQFKQGSTPTVHATLTATGSPCDNLMMYYPHGFVTAKIVTVRFFASLHAEADVPQPPYFPIDDPP